MRSSSSSRLLKDSAHTLAAQILTMIVSAGVGILTARLLSAAERGIYVLPVIDSELAGTLFSGISMATSYYMLAQQRGRGILRPTFITSLVFLVAGGAMISGLAVAQHHVWVILPAIASVIPTVLIMFVTGYCYGVHRVREANYLSVMRACTRVALLAAGMLLIGRYASVAIWAWVLSTAVTAAASIVYLRGGFRGLSDAPVPLGDYAAYASKISVTSVVTTLNFRADMYIIAVLMSPAILSIYSVAVAASEAMKVLTLALSKSATPLIGSLDVNESAQLTARCVRVNFLIALPPTLIVLIFAPWLLRMIFGPTYEHGAEALRILVLGVFSLAPSSLLSAFYTLKLGRPMVSFWTSMLSGVVCALMSLLLIPHLGMTGAAIASAASYAASTIAIGVIFVRANRLRPSSVFIVRWDDLRPVMRMVQSVARRIRPAA